MSPKLTRGRDSHPAGQAPKSLSSGLLGSQPLATGCRVSAMWFRDATQLCLETADLLLYASCTHRCFSLGSFTE